MGPGSSHPATFVLAFAASVALGPCSRGGGASADTGGAAPPRPSEEAAPASARPSLDGTADARPASTRGAPGSPVSGRSAVVPHELNLLLITIDCLRADMPWAGYPRPIAPRLTDLATRSVKYTRAYSLSSYTSMSLGGLLGGKLPGEMRRDGYFFGVYSKENVMFPELLQAAGVHTLAAHAHGYFHDAGFDQGFDRWEVLPNLKWNNTTDENVTSPELESLAERLLSEPATGDRPFFAWFHFLDPHDKYMPHPGIGPYGNTPRDRYDAEVTFTDQYIGKLLDFVAARPWGARTAIIVTADHGEAFGEHRQWVHGFELWDNLVRVPLLFVIPGVQPRTIDEPRGAVDLAPTILELLHVSVDAPLDASTAPRFEGTSLLPEIQGAEPVPRDIVIDLPETSDNDRRRAVVHGTTKLIAFGKSPYFQVFDLAADPGELHPITRGSVFDDMLVRYRAADRAAKDLPPTKCREGCLDGAYAKKDGGD